MVICVGNANNPPLTLDFWPLDVYRGIRVLTLDFLWSFVELGTLARLLAASDL